jgi:hypothetical protein
VVFLYIPVEEADVLEERMEGKLFISDIVYALMPKYEKTIGLDIPVVDATYDETLRELAKWLRKRSETKP